MMTTNYNVELHDAVICGRYKLRPIEHYCFTILVWMLQQKIKNGMEDLLFDDEDNIKFDVSASEIIETIPKKVSLGDISLALQGLCSNTVELADDGHTKTTFLKQCAYDSQSKTFSVVLPNSLTPYIAGSIGTMLLKVSGHKINMTPFK